MKDDQQINTLSIGALELERFKMALELADEGSKEAIHLRNLLIEDEGNYSKEELIIETDLESSENSEDKKRDPS